MPLARLPKKALCRWTGLCVALLGQGSISSAEAFLRELRLDGRTLGCATVAAGLLKEPLPASPAEWKRLLNRCGVEPVSCAAAVSDASFGGGSGKALKAVLRSGECFSVRHLAVTGDDLLSLGLSGRELGEMLRFLLDYVIDYPENNRRELLLALAAGGGED